MRRILCYWGPVVLWLALMVAAATDAFSAQHTSFFLYRLFKATGVPYSRWELYHFLVRKTAHFVEFAVFSVLVFRGFRGTTLAGEPRAWTWRWAAWAWGVCIVAAAANEIQQMFVPSRTASVKDVVIDSAGAAVAQVIIWMVLRQRERDAGRASATA